MRYIAFALSLLVAGSSAEAAFGFLRLKKKTDAPKAISLLEPGRKGGQEHKYFSIEKHSAKYEKQGAGGQRPFSRVRIEGTTPHLMHSTVED